MSCNKDKSDDLLLYNGAAHANRTDKGVTAGVVPAPSAVALSFAADDGEGKDSMQYSLTCVPIR